MMAGSRSSTATYLVLARLLSTLTLAACSIAGARSQKTIWDRCGLFPGMPSARPRQSWCSASAKARLSGLFQHPEDAATG